MAALGVDEMVIVLKLSEMIASLWAALQDLSQLLGVLGAPLESSGSSDLVSPDGILSKCFAHVRAACLLLLSLSHYYLDKHYYSKGHVRRAIT